MTAETSNARGDVVAERQAWYEQQIALAEGQWAAAFLDRWECGDDVPSKEHYVALWLAERAAPQPAGDAEAEALAKYQPCGCVICTCEDEKQCQGCGAKHCGNRTNHPAYVKQQPEARGVVDVYTMQTIADAAAALDKRGDRQMAARLIRLHTRLLATQHQEPKS